uniref:Uncharacterized protein n=1 Tax=Arundo donax TaxID=35708 RepID=A0A0A8ZN92_ARUDO
MSRVVLGLQSFDPNLFFFLYVWRCVQKKFCY